MPIEMLSRIGRMLYGIGSLMTGAKVSSLHPVFFLYMSLHVHVHIFACISICFCFSLLMNSWIWLNGETKGQFTRYYTVCSTYIFVQLHCLHM